MCVLTLGITFARLSKACFDPERETFKSDGLIYNYCRESVVFTIKRAASNRSGKWTVIVDSQRTTRPYILKDGALKLPL
jgi:hypothetical protein